MTKGHKKEPRIKIIKIVEEKIKEVKKESPSDEGSELEKELEKEVSGREVLTSSSSRPSPALRQSAISSEGTSISQPPLTASSPPQRENETSPRVYSTTTSSTPRRYASSSSPSPLFKPASEEREIFRPMDSPSPLAPKPVVHREDISEVKERKYEKGEKGKARYPWER